MTEARLACWADIQLILITYSLQATGGHANLGTPSFTDLAIPIRAVFPFLPARCRVRTWGRTCGEAVASEYVPAGHTRLRRWTMFWPRDVAQTKLAPDVTGTKSKPVSPPLQPPRVSNGSEHEPPCCDWVFKTLYSQRAKLFHHRELILVMPRSYQAKISSSAGSARLSLRVASTVSVLKCTSDLQVLDYGLAKIMRGNDFLCVAGWQR
ncbi:hypothetical protein F4802DRAFT_498420 [Xylaria palmicola]|nr:hypothetical protein F4802DRAFT_498420 [Xylaria palmicola]